MLATLTALSIERQDTHDHEQEDSTEYTDTNHHPLDNPQQVPHEHAEEETTAPEKGDEELVSTLSTAGDQ